MSSIDRRLQLAVAVCALLLVPGMSASAQVPGTQAPDTPAATARDPLGRESPFGTITGFSTAVRRDEVAVASQYLQRGGRSQAQVETIARDLSDLLDRYFTQTLSSLSNASTGNLADGLAADRERIQLRIGDETVDLFLTRVADPTAGSIWLFASESLARVPALQRSQGATWLEQVMPAPWLESRYFGLSLAQWILWSASILAPLLLFWVLTTLVATAWHRRITDLTSRAVFQSSWHGVRWPLVVGLTLVLHLAAMRLLGFSLTFRVAYARLGLGLLVLVVAVLLWRFVAITFRQGSLIATRRGHSNTRSLIMLGERVAKVVVVMVAVFALLALAGVDPTTALAGVGLAGVAVALGAQKTVENLLGGIFLLSDQALAVGDYCRLSDREGWIEDITLRSVRLRTLEQTLLSVPAGLLAQGSIENYASRRRILMQSLLRLRYGTTVEQLETILDDTRRLLTTHPDIDRESARIRLVAFGPQGIELELFAYATTSDFTAFLAVRESLLMRIAQTVEAAGSAFVSSAPPAIDTGSAAKPSPLRV